MHVCRVCVLYEYCVKLHVQDFIYDLPSTRSSLSVVCECVCAYVVASI